jgi:hypothetical protein
MTAVAIQDTNLLLRWREWLKQNAPTAKVQENEVQINWTDGFLALENLNA